MPTPIYLTLRKLSQNQDLKPNKYRLSKFYGFFKNIFWVWQPCISAMRHMQHDSGGKIIITTVMLCWWGRFILKVTVSLQCKKVCLSAHYPPATTWRCDPCACGLQSLPPPPEQLMKYGWLEFCRCSVKSRIGVILHTRPRLWSSDTRFLSPSWIQRSEKHGALSIYFYVVMLCL